MHYAVLLSDYNKINSQRHYTYYDNILLDIKKKIKKNNGIVHQNKRQKQGREVRLWDIKVM